MSRELVEMKKDVDIDFKIEDCKFGNLIKPRLSKVTTIRIYSLVGRLGRFKK